MCLLAETAWQALPCLMQHGKPWDGIAGGTVHSQAIRVDSRNSTGQAGKSPRQENQQSSRKNENFWGLGGSSLDLRMDLKNTLKAAAAG